MPSADQDPSDTSADSPSLSRRAVLLAGAALMLGACSGPRKSLDPMAGVVRRPAGGTGSIGPAKPAGGGATDLPLQPEAPIAGAGGYTLVARNTWTNLPIKGNNNPMGTVTRITVHHTGEHGHWADISDVEVVQRIERYHRTEKEWAAIGYHFLVGRDGRVYEGRPARYQGAHVSTQNENNLGISVIGDFMDHLPSQRQLVALTALLNDKRELYGVSRARTYGHRDLHASQCPGDALYAWVKRYKSGQV